MRLHECHVLTILILTFAFFYERTRRFVVKGPRVWLFGRSEGMVLKQIFSECFGRLLRGAARGAGIPAHLHAAP